MITMPINFETERLIIRPWNDRDKEPFARLNSDPEVMRYFPSVLTREQSDAFVERARQKTQSDGFCIWPIDEKQSAQFLGFVGLAIPRYQKPLPFEPCVEIGWRLDRSAWGKGYATEAAHAWLRFGVETLRLEEIVSFTARLNRRSQRVMQRLGMTYDPADNFLHPTLPDGHPLQLHVLYRLKRADWRQRQLGDDR